MALTFFLFIQRRNGTKMRLEAVGVLAVKNQR